MSTLNEIVRRRINRSPEGSYAVFIDIGDIPRYKKWAIKLTWSPKMRDDAFRTQKLCAKHKIAPPVGRKIDLCINSQKMFGYTTRIAKILVDIYASSRDYAIAESFHAQNIQSVCRIYERITGETYYDDHAGNFGWYRRRFVIIDFTLRL